MLTNIRDCIWYHVILQWSLIVFSSNYSNGVELGKEIGEKIKLYNMEDSCGQTVNMRNEKIYAAVINFRAFRSPPNCTFTIKPGSWYLGWNSMSVQIRHFDIADFSCVTLKRVDAAGSYSKIVHRFCRDSYGLLYKQFGSSNDESLIFEYEEDQYSREQAYPWIKLNIAVTLYHVARCYSHLCDNSRCIPSELMCQGYNPCGDGSDCPKEEEEQKKQGLSKGSIVAIILSIVFIFCLILYCWFVRIKKMEEGSSRSSNPSDDLSDRRYSAHSSCNDVDVNSRLYREYWEDDDSLELQPFYTQEGVIRRPMNEHLYNNHNDRNTVHDEQVHVPSISSSPPSPSSPPPPPPHTPPQPLSDETTQVTDVIVEPPHIDVYELDAHTPTVVTAAGGDVNDMFVNVDILAPPPSYEEVITHGELYKTSSRETIDPT